MRIGFCTLTLFAGPMHASAQDAYPSQLWPAPAHAVEAEGVVLPAVVTWAGTAAEAPFDLTPGVRTGYDCDPLVYPYSGASYTLVGSDAQVVFSGPITHCMAWQQGDRVHGLVWNNTAPPVDPAWYGLATTTDASPTPIGATAAGALADSANRTVNVPEGGGMVTYAPSGTPMDVTEVAPGALVTLVHTSSVLLLVVPTPSGELKYFALDYSSATLRGAIVR